MKEIIALSMLIPIMLITLFALHQPLLFAFQLGIIFPIVLLQSLTILPRLMQKKQAAIRPY